MSIRAVIVGIETYGGALEEVVSPAVNALAIAEWALTRGVAAEDIFLFIAAATVPGAPTLNSATAGNGQVTLSWSAPSSNGGSAITSYKVAGRIVGELRNRVRGLLNLIPDEEFVALKGDGTDAFELRRTFSAVSDAEVERRSEHIRQEIMAFLDRLHFYLPGWEVPRRQLQPRHIWKFLGQKALLHFVRQLQLAFQAFLDHQFGLGGLQRGDFGLQLLHQAHALNGQGCLVGKRSQHGRFTRLKTLLVASLNNHPAVRPALRC